MRSDLDKLVDYLKERRAVDFTAYRPAVLQRRIGLRLSAAGSADYGSYLSLLQKEPRELDALIDALSIKVSGFFRNPLVFDVLHAIILPALLETFGCGLRIWSAGCARGEEAYSVAILIRETADLEACSPDAFLIGTDIDEGALAAARDAVYNPESVADVRMGLLERHFLSEGGRYRLKDAVRSMVRFVRHDVTTGTGPSEGVFTDYHVILCRNVLIYYDRSVQERILGSLTGMISSGGYLVLGEAESLIPPLSNQYEEVMRGAKIFRKK